jgi:hypothetical protein
MFVVQNMNQYNNNDTIHSTDLHLPFSRLPTYQKVTFYVGTTYSTEQSPYWESNQFSASQEIPHILCNPKVHCRIHKWPLIMDIRIFNSLPFEIKALTNSVKKLKKP